MVIEFLTPGDRTGVPDAVSSCQALSPLFQGSEWSLGHKETPVLGWRLQAQTQKAIVCPSVCPQAQPRALGRCQAAPWPACTPCFPPCTRSLTYRLGHVSGAPWHTLDRTLALLGPCQTPASSAQEEKMRADSLEKRAQVCLGPPQPGLCLPYSNTWAGPGQAGLD